MHGESPERRLNRQPQWPRMHRFPDTRPLGWTARPARQRHEKVARFRSRMRCTEQLAARHDDETIVHPARRDERTAARAREHLVAIAHT